MNGIGSHHSADALREEWLTPPNVLAALGGFDLDPCAPIVRPWPTATRYYTKQDNGLVQPWAGRVFCNPPYGAKATPWLKRCAAHGNAVALLFARTDTEMFFECVWDGATAALFLLGRLHFHHPNGQRARANSGGPSVLVAYDNENAAILAKCGLAGKFIALEFCQGAYPHA